MYIYFCLITMVMFFSSCNQKQDNDILKLGEDIVEDTIQIIEDKTVL